MSIKVLIESIDGDLKDINKLIKEVPNKIDAVLTILEEMHKGSEPDENADYWEEKEDIEGWIEILKSEKEKFEKLEKIIQKKSDKFDDLKSQFKHAHDLGELQNIYEDLNSLKNVIIDDLNVCLDIQQIVDDIYKDMDDCCIPGNIARRRNEVEQFGERIA